MILEEDFLSEEVLFEITLSNLTEKRISRSKLIIDEPTVLMVIPDTNVELDESIYSSGFIFTNCYGIISPNKIFKFGFKMFNNKPQFLELKKKFLSMKAEGKKLNVVGSVPTKMKEIKDDHERKFWIYDLTILRDVYLDLKEKFGEKVSALKFINFVAEKYNSIKNENRSLNVECVFLFKNTEGEIFNLFKNIKILLPQDKLKKISFYDHLGLVSILNTNTIIPFFYKRKGYTDYYFPNLRYIEKALENNLEDIEKNKEEESDTSTEIKTKNDIISAALSSNVVDKKEENVTNSIKNFFLTKNVKKEDEDKVEFYIDEINVTDVLKKYRITDPDVVASVQSALDEYKKIKKSEKISKKDAELCVLKAINNVVYGHDYVNKEFIRNPNILIEKLVNKFTHQEPLYFDKTTRESSVVDPKEIIDLEYTTGVWRQKKEFEDTIHKNIRKLFKTLENSSEHPVKVLDISHTIQDDDLNRIIKYVITLQNSPKSGYSKPYKVYLNIPGIVNDRYFRINGVTSIMAMQQFLKPITKTTIDDVRLLTNYAIVRLKLEKLKFTPTEINSILNYVKIKYPKLVKEHIDGEKIVFSDNSVLYLDEKNNKIYEDSDNEIVFDDKEFALLNKKNNEYLKIKKRIEFMYEKILEKIHTVNPLDDLTTTKKSIPYISIYLGGFKLPYIIYLWQAKGLLSGLNDFGIHYEIKNEEDKNSKYTIKLTSGEFLNIYPETQKQKFICNGLLVFKVDKINNLEDLNEIKQIINTRLGANASYNIREIMNNMIDPITKELLQFENLPTNLNSLLSEHCIDKLINDPVSHINDLKTYRLRLSEMMLNIMYSQIKQAHNEYKRKVELGDPEAKIHFYDNYVIDNIYSYNGVLMVTSPINPVEEIYFSSKSIKSGPNGVNNKQSFKKEQRMIHESHIGVLGANSTSESGNVGLDVGHTITPPIINEFGSYSKKPLNLSGWNYLSANEMLTPFMNEMDSDRMVLAATHSKQTTPTNGNEPPLVGTGAEFIIPQIASSRFVHRAENKGKVVKVVPNEYITVKYSNGTEQTFDIVPRLSRSKMNYLILLEMNTLKEGDSFEKGQIIAWSKSFNKNGMYCSGTNCVMAVTPYNGLNHEDAYCISERLAGKMTRDIIREVSIVIPPDTKVLNLVDKIGKQVESNENLVEFVYNDELEDFMKLMDIDTSLDSEEESELSSISKDKGSMKLNAKNGKIVDIKIYLNNKNVDPKILNAYKKLVSEVKKITSLLPEEKKNDNLDLKFLKIGEHKLKSGKIFTGARIVYYIKQEIPLVEGDKLALRHGVKGLISKVIKEPATTEKTELQVDVFLSPCSIFGRKNIAVLKELYIGKVIYFLDKKVKEMAADPKKETNDIVKLIIDIYEIMGSDQVKKAINKKMKTIDLKEFRSQLKQEDYHLFFPIPPFTSVSFENIQKAAKLLKIELDEKIYLKEFNCWTTEKVPVGISYIQALEQTSDIYMNSRSVGKYDSITGQATKGKSREGGQSIGFHDLNAFLTYGADNVLKEMLTLRSDDHSNKRNVINEIIFKGKAQLPKTKLGASNDVFKMYLTSMGLEVTSDIE